jgi:nucleotide-binding universal stress UspA family protein
MILVAADGSPSSTDAISFAVELASEHLAELIFVHLVPTLDLVPTSGSTASAARSRTSPPSTTMPSSRTRQQSPHHTRWPATTALLGGSIVEEIVACGGSCDVIVAGSRRHGAVASALLGSVSLGVLRHSNRPVLIVHGAIDIAEAEPPT